MKLLIICLLVMTSAAIAGGSRPTATEIQSRIDVEGGRKVLWDLWAHQKEFSEVSAGIESGDPVWLQIAVELHEYSDAGASEELDYAVALALPIATERVLALVNHGFALEQICTSPFDGPEAGVAETYEKKTLSALAAVRAPVLKALALECSKRIRLP